MKKRWLLRLGLLGGVGLGGFWFVLWWTAPRYSICQHAFDRIQIGMTQDEVIAIIGVAPGEYDLDSYSRERFLIENHTLTADNRARFLLRDKMRGYPGYAQSQGFICKEWYCITGGIQLGFDKEGKVAFDANFPGNIAGQFVAFPDSLANKVRRILRIR